MASLAKFRGVRERGLGGDRPSLSVVGKSTRKAMSMVSQLD